MKNLIDILVAYSKDTGEDVQRYIDELSRPDIIHCSECRWLERNRCRRFSSPPWSNFYMNADDFCSGGERK